MATALYRGKQTAIPKQAGNYFSQCTLKVNDRDGHRITMVTITGKNTSDLDRKADAELARLAGLYPNCRISREFV